MPNTHTPQEEENLNPIFSLRVSDTGLLKKINKYSKQYQSRNFAILDLIKTHPDFVKMFPKK